jgi:hypothetical protein
VVGGFYAGGAKASTNQTHVGVGLNPATAEALAARWADPAVAQAEFKAALYGTDPVELDLVFMRAHALHRWDLLPGWYQKTWTERGTVRSFAAPAAAKLPKVLDTFTSAGQLSGLIVTGFDASGAPVLGTAKVTGTEFYGYTVAGPVAPFVIPEKANPADALRYLGALTPPTTVAHGDGFDTVPTTGLANQSTGGTWTWFWSKAAKWVPPPHPSVKGGYYGLHNWDQVWKLQVNSVDGAKWVPKSAWTGPFSTKLVGLALDADTLRDSPEWQEKAALWWSSYLEFCPQFGMPHTAGHLPPLWQRPSVSYRPHWWVVDADWLRARLDIPQPQVFAAGHWYDVPDWQAVAFQQAVADWIGEGAHIVDPYGWWGHIACENWAEGPDFVDILGLIFALGVVSVIAPAVAGSLVGAFGFAGTTLGGALADLGASVVGSGLGSEATGGTFGEGFEEVFENPIDVVVDLAGGVVEDVLDLADGTVEDLVDEIEAAIEDPLELLGDVAGGALEDVLDLAPGTIEDLVEDPLGALGDAGAELLEDVLELGEGTIGGALDLLDGDVTENAMDLLDQFVPDSFEEGLDWIEEGLEIYDLFDDLFDGDPNTGFDFGEFTDYLGGEGDEEGGATPPTLPPDVGLPGDFEPAGGSSVLQDLAPLLVIGLLAMLALKG